MYKRIANALEMCVLYVIFGHNQKDIAMGHSLLSGKRGILFGALDAQSIAWQVALQSHAEGGRFVLSNTPLALRMGAVQTLAETCNTRVIPADATSVEDLQELFRQATNDLRGPIDFILHSIGMSPNVRKNKPYGELSYDFFHKTLDISALSLHKILQVAEQSDSLAQGASVVALSYIAASRTFPYYSDMAEAKALLESIVRSYGYRLGKKQQVRVNAISQSPTKTTAGQGIKGFDVFFDYAQSVAPLGNATAQDCANYCVFLFSDLSQRISMQTLMCDGGFSSVGLSEALFDTLAQKAAKH